MAKAIWYVFVDLCKYVLSESIKYFYWAPSIAKHYVRCYGYKRGRRFNPEFQVYNSVDKTNLMEIEKAMYC